MRSPVYQAIRIGYIALIIGLTVFALLTYRELSLLRSSPVILPAYRFYIVDIPEKTSLIQVHGTWLMANGSMLNPGLLETTSIECRKWRQQCIESTATVSVSEKGYLESIPSVFEIESWTDSKIVTKPLTERCAVRTITLDLEKRMASSETVLAPGAKECKDVPRALKLESGIRAGSETRQK